MTSRVLYSTQYHRQHCTLHAFEQFGALYMPNHDDKYPSRPGYETGTPRLQALVDTNEPSSGIKIHILHFIKRQMRPLNSEEHDNRVFTICQMRVFSYIMYYSSLFIDWLFILSLKTKYRIFHIFQW